MPIVHSAKLLVKTLVLPIFSASTGTISAAPSALFDAARLAYTSQDRPLQCIRFSKISEVSAYLFSDRKG